VIKLNTMKKIILLMLIVFCGILQKSVAQAPENINYQAIARDTAGNPLSNQALTIRLTIVKTSVSGPTIWQETHSVTTNTFGQYRLQLGLGASTGLGSAPTFATINWGNAIHFLRTEINTGSGFVVMGTDPLSSVPYSLYSKKTEALPNGTVNGQILSWDGTNWVPATICSLLTQYYRDADGDTYGNPAVSAGSCFQPAGYVLNSSDCNDNNANVNPSISELCNAIDDNCDALIDNGAPVLTDPNNCGSCGNVCPPLPNSTPSCLSGLCSFVCNFGYADCNNFSLDGCEVNLLSDANNCGSCGVACFVKPNSSPVCVSGVCSIICNPNFGNCNSNLNDGCEINLLTNVSNCGSCGLTCPPAANATSVCVSGVCSIICTGNFRNCNANITDGCEVNILSNSSNCGACGNACPSLPNATVGCSSGLCFIIACNVGFANCNGITGDGCEVSLSANTSNCGSCTTVCPTRPNSLPVCVSGVCSISCNSGFANCNANNTDGCEINLLTNSSNCGACGAVCSAGKVCVNGVCQ
jgi:hypothetical protein